MDAKRTLYSLLHCLLDKSLINSIVVYGSDVDASEWSDLSYVRVLLTSDANQVREQMPADYWLETSDACIYFEEGYLLLDAIEAICNTKKQVAYLGQPYAKNFASVTTSHQKQFCQHYLQDDDDETPVALLRRGNV